MQVRGEGRDHVCLSPVVQDTVGVLECTTNVSFGDASCPFVWWRHSTADTFAPAPVGGYPFACRGQGLSPGFRAGLPSFAWRNVPEVFRESINLPPPMPRFLPYNPALLSLLLFLPWGEETLVEILAGVSVHFVSFRPLFVIRFIFLVPDQQGVAVRRENLTFPPLILPCY